MSEIINVALVVQAEEIVEAYKSQMAGLKKKQPEPQKHPQHVDFKYIQMVTKVSHQKTTNGKKVLKASVEDEVRWRATTLSFNTNTHYSVVLYKFNPHTGSSDQEVISPKPFLAEVKAVYPANTVQPFGSLKLETYNDFQFHGETQKTGDLTYDFYFMLVDQDLKNMGYYKWESGITVSNP